MESNDKFLQSTRPKFNLNNNDFNFFSKTVETKCTWSNSLNLHVNLFFYCDDILKNY